VMFGSSLPGVIRRLAAAAPALALTLLAGCDATVTGKYPDELTYPARTDPIVTEAPGEEHFYADPPGTFEHFVEQIGVAKENGGPGGKAVKPGAAPADKRQQLNAELQKLFGTPANPAVNVGDDEAAKAMVKELGLETAALASGSQLYRRHCLTCHGLTGDGRGPTGPWVNPHPRDYRQGVFKFVSSNPDLNGRKPRRADLLRTLNAGVDGTTMPSFALLPADQLEQIVSYIIHLSIRGETEIEALRPLLAGTDLYNEEGGTDESTVVTHARFILKKLVLKNWATSNKSVMDTAPYPYAENNEQQRRESVVRGYQLFTNSTAEEHPKAVKGPGCIACHQDFGRQVNFKYDAWGSLVRPANLTTGVFRGGRRPVDIYWRIRGGIPPSQMPLVKLMNTLPDGKDGDKIDGNKYWDLVNFIQALPYPEMLPPEVRNKVYPPASKQTAESQHASR
jgi:mono/diheme cytochrome c family protein